MTLKQVDFYLISNQVSNAEYKLASRLANKLARLQQRALVVTDTAQSSEQLDQIMWSFSDSSFVAHDRIIEGTAVDPFSNIHISEISSYSNEPHTPDYDVLINLCGAVPVFNHHFTRIAEIVPDDENAKAQARHRFKTYKEEGFEVKTHSIEL